jgi:hypothetical protein
MNILSLGVNEYPFFAPKDDMRPGFGSRLVLSKRTTFNGSGMKNFGGKSIEYPSL